MKTTPILLLLAAFAARAVEPNYVKSTSYDVDGNGNNLVSTTYSNGLGRRIQSKINLNDTDRVSCVFYDEAGRPDTATKAFVDLVNLNSYLPGDLATLNGAGGPLRNQYSTDTKPYSYTKYSDDPLSTKVEQNGPGEEFTDYPLKTYYFGVRKATYTIPTTPTVSIIEGLISTTITDAIIAALGGYTPGAADPVPDHYLTVTKTMVLDDGATVPRPVFTQELKDAFGKTMVTKSTPSSGVNIIAKYSYDILGNLTKEIAPTPAGATIGDTKYTYNTLGQLVKKETPDGGWFGYTYTTSGQLEYDTSYIMNGGVKQPPIRFRKYTYDNLDRLITMSTKKLEADPYIDVLKNYYDNTKALVAGDAKKYGIPLGELNGLTNLRGRMVASVAMNSINGSSYFVTDFFTYDDDGRMKRKVKIVPGMPVQYTGFKYDLQGKVLFDTVMCGTDKNIREYGYDAEGRLDTIKHGSDEIAAYHYSDLGRMDKKNLKIGAGAGHDITYNYNIREWKTSIASPVGMKGFSESINEYAANGNIKGALYDYQTSVGSTIKDTLDYAYDDANRLVSVGENSVTNYGIYNYDEIGRITSKKEGSDYRPGYRYYTGNNRLRTTKNNDTDEDFYYDKHGNMVVDINKKMVIEYDWRDMPMAFRFYSDIPSGVGVDTKGVFTVPTGYTDLYKYVTDEVNKTGATITLLSQVVMLYDASGNRVLKMEGK